MAKKGFTLVELLVTILLIPLVGLTLYHLNFFVDQSFRRTTARMLPEQEVEVTLGYMAKDIMAANSVEVTSGGAPVAVGDPGDGMILTIDDNITPANTADDDEIEYTLFDGTLERVYTVRPSGSSSTKVVARNITSLQLVQDANEASLPFPRNIIRATVTSTVGGIASTGTRTMSSRALEAVQPLP